MNAPFEAYRSPLSNPRKPPSSIRTLVDLVRWQADTRGGSTAFTHLPDQSVIPRTLTFAELDQRARAIAVALREHGSKGDRVLIVQQPGLEYVSSLLGAMYAGMISVPVYPPDLFRLRQTLPRLQAITAEADARVMLSSREILGNEVSPLWQLCKDAAIATDEISGSLASEWKAASTSHLDLALLQFTSGSTGTPRGVALSHANLMANAEQGFYAFDVPDAVCVFWLPPYHDLGLIGGMLIPLFGGRPSVLMSPIAFVQEPLRWFRAITDYRGTTTASPNFGYEWCIRKIDLSACEGIDLSTLRLAAVGAEPIRSGTLKRFAEKFSPLGFSASAFTPGYGMAEATLAVTNKPLGTSPVVRSFDRSRLIATPPVGVPLGATSPSNGELENAKESTIDLVSSGRPVVGCEVCIVDPITLHPLPDGSVGEIWIRSPGVACGYWQNPEVSIATFGVQFQIEAAEHRKLDCDVSQLPENLRDGLTLVDGYLRSGDLGFLLDGELYVSGRLKEQIIIAGRNFFPHDIEAAIQSAHEAFKVDGGIAFSVEQESGEELVIVHEILRPKRFNLDELVKVVLQTVLDQFGVVPRTICLVAAASLPKTSSGKLRRIECRTQFLENELQTLTRWDAESVSIGTSSTIDGASEDEDGKSVPFSLRLSLRQKEVAQIWCDVLDLNAPMRNQHFLEVGGHSLSAHQLIARIREKVALEFSIADLFQFPTLGELLDEVERRASEPCKSNKDAENHLSAGQPLPLTDAQQGFWWLEQLGRDDAFLRVGITLTATSSCDREKLVEVCRSLPQRHPSLRTQFVTGSEGLPYQQLLDAAEIPVQVLDLRGLSPAQQERRVTEIREALTRAPFDLSVPPLIRIALCLNSDEHFQLVIVGHHIVCDGLSLWLLAEDIVRGVSGGDIDYSIEDWTNAIARHTSSSGGIYGDSESHIHYWNERLKAVAADQSLHLTSEFLESTDHDRLANTAGKKHPSQKYHASLHHDQASAIAKLAIELKVTPFSIYTTLWHAVLDSYRTDGDLVFGIPLANRIHSTEERVVGTFISTIPFRLDFLKWDSDENSNVDLPSECNRTEFIISSMKLRANILKTHRQWLEDYRHSALSLEKIIETSGVDREDGSLPLIRHLVLHQPSFAFNESTALMKVIDYRADYSSLAAYETALVVESHPQRTEVGVVFDPARIPPSIAEWMLQAFVGFVDQLIEASAGESPKMVSPCSTREQQRLLFLGRGRRLADEPANFLERFGDQVRQFPNSIAIQTDEQTWTYKRLDSESSRIAAALSQMGVKAESVVAVNVARTAPLTALLIGIWKAGGAYLPIDPSHPVARIHEVLADAQPLCWIDDDPNAVAFVPNAPSVRHVRFGDLLDLARTMSDRYRNDETIPTNRLAYLIYTSGSTGKPKGVAVEHASVSNLIRSFSRQPGFHRREAILASTTISFDISVLELFLPLAVGGVCVLASSSLAESPEKVLNTLTTRVVDVIQGTPSSLRLLLDIGWMPVRGQRVWCGGEAMPASLARELLSFGVELWNVYGPTETTVWSMVHRVTSSDSAMIPIGQPIDATDIYILDRRNRLAPIGVQGELCVGGEGLSRGYWQRADLTAERFFLWGSPFRDVVKSQAIRLYRTGDLARWLPSGQLEFLGRRDRQIKLLGHRIELGEVEAALAGYKGVSIAAVTVTPTSEGPQRIIAFYTADEAAQVDHESLMTYLRQRLPSSMLPSVILPLSVMPKTPAGKIDYQSLPLEQCILNVGKTSGESVEVVSPRDEVEKNIASVWCEVLKRESIGINDNFFHLGGHSLAAAQVFSRLRSHFDEEIPLREVYQRPTIASLAEWYRGKPLDGNGSRSSEDIEVNLRLADCHLPIASELATSTEEEFRTDRNQVAAEINQPNISIQELPLSFAEERLWVVEQVEPNHPFYNLPLAANVRGPLDRDRFGKALQSCVQRHETLRSTYYWHDKAPRRRIHSFLEIKPTFIDLSGTIEGPASETTEPADSIVLRMMREESRKTFDLEVGPLFRAIIYKVEEDRHFVLLVMHHIISDGWSMAVLLAEIAEFYRADQLGVGANLPLLELTYTDYAKRQQATAKDTEQYERDLRYWTRNLDGCTETLDLPTDFERPPVQTFDGAIFPIRFDKDLTDRIEKLAIENQATPFMVFLAGYIAVISRYSRQTDFNIGSAVANRPEAALERLIGFFVSTIVFRARIEGTPTFAELLEQIKWTAIEGFAHSALPFEELIKHFVKTRDRSHSPMFQAAFVMQNAPRDFATAPGLSIQPMHIDNGTAKYDLTLFLWKEGDSFVGHVEYRSQLFLESSIHQFCDSLVSFLDTSTSLPNQPIDATVIVTNDRQAAIRERSFGPRKAFEGPTILHDLIEYRVQQDPGHLAVVYRNSRWTYGEFWKEIRAIARGLQRKGGQTPVVIYLPRSAQQLAAQIAVNCCGYAFVPVDVNFPTERVSAIAKNVGASWIITDEISRNSFVEFNEKSFECITVDELIEGNDGDWESVVVHNHDPAYLIFTSGSTGKPKGVVVEHHSICNFVHCFCEVVGMTREDRCSHTLSPSFDGALSESLTALTRGATLVIIDSEDVVDPRRLTAILREHAVTFGAFTPPILSSLFPEQLPSLRRVLSGGAKLSAEVAERWLTSREIFNGYGPTECTIGSAIQRVSLPIGRNPAVGRPMANMSMYILDGNLRLVPDGVPGEVFIGGVCVAREYWNQPSLTADRFVHDPFTSTSPANPSPRMYRTGDLGRWNSNGLIEILGRCDDQIKLRGYRIEPGEISSVLDNLPEVSLSTVVAWGDSDEAGIGQRLIAYVVPSHEFTDAESSIEKEHVESWRDLFDESQQRSGLALRPEDNFSGWQSVLTGRPIDLGLMAQWADATARRISDLNPKRILEVGCGTGLILLRLDASFDHYFGVDLLDSALEQLRRTLEGRPGLATKVKLEQRTADTLEQISPEKFDTVVLNSVVQYFPSLDYFLGVLRKVVDLTEMGGRIFLGDLRDLRLQAAFAVEVEAHRAMGENVNSAQFKRRVLSRIEHDEELVIDPRMFHHLKRWIPRIADISIQYKIGDDANELNRYRFDVILQLDDATRLVGGNEVPYGDSPWVDRNGRWRLPQVLWACLAGSTHGFEIEELTHDCEQWLKQAVDLNQLENFAREDGYSWKNIDPHFDADKMASWTNHPMERRKQLSLTHRLREQLKTRLPDYMIPSAFVLMDALPKTVQGKIDRAALPPPPAVRPQGAEPIVSPRDEWERLIADVWESLLEISPISVEDDFFTLGGHSMLAVRMVNEIAAQSGVQIPLAALFRQPTVAHLAELIRNPKPSEATSSLVRLNKTDRGVPLYCVHPAGGTAFCYLELATLLESERPVFGVQARGVDGSETPHHDMAEMSTYYAKAILENTPEGPLDVLGWSIGGNIAYEVARQLRNLGAVVRDTYLVDAGVISGETEMSEEDFLPLLSALFPDQAHQSLEELRSQTPEQQAHYFLTQAAKAGILPIDTDVLGMDIFRVFQANLKAVHNYRMTPQEGTIHLIRPEDQSKTSDLFDDPTLGWRQWVDEVIVEWVPGDHAGMLQGEAVLKIAELVK